MGILSTFAINMRSYRKRAGLTQEQLAEKSGLHRTYIGGIEQHRINVSLKNISKIAAALNVDPALLLLRSPTDEEGLPLNLNSGQCDYALVSWSDEAVHIHELSVEDPSLSIQILNALIAEGYQGDDLVERYHRSQREMLRIFKEQLAAR